MEARKGLTDGPVYGMVSAKGDNNGNHTGRTTPLPARQVYEASGIPACKMRLRSGRTGIRENAPCSTARTRRETYASRESHLGTSGASGRGFKMTTRPERH